MPLNYPNKKTSTEGAPPPIPTLGTRITVFVILALIVACPILWMFGAVNPMLEPLSPLVCPDGSRLTTRFETVRYWPESSKKDTTKVNFDCVDPSGSSVKNNADIILFSACGGPFIGLLLWGFVGSFFRKEKIKLEAPVRRRRS